MKARRDGRNKAQEIEATKKRITETSDEQLTMDKNARGNDSFPNCTGHGVDSV